jgi:hypothetical protein
MTLGEALSGAAAELDGVESRQSAGSTEWTWHSRLFATASWRVAEFLLEPIVVRAALGTPDTKPSSRGAQWVAFGPAELDQYALDRATAWLRSAHRYASARRA